MTSSKPQDLPPEGGYRKIPFARVPAKTYFGGQYRIFKLNFWNFHVPLLFYQIDNYNCLSATVQIIFLILSWYLVT